MAGRSIGWWVLCGGVLLAPACIPTPPDETLLQGALIRPLPTYSAEQAQANPLDLTAHQEALALAGTVAGAGAVELFAFVGGAPGDELTIQASQVASRTVVALLDADLNLLARQGGGGRHALTYVLRRPALTFYVAVGMTSELGGGPYRLTVTRRRGQPIPAPRPQLVWLNFGGATELSVNYVDSLTFGPFDVAQLGTGYGDDTEQVKDTIVATLREIYAGYNVTFLRSDHDEAPLSPHSTIHFGGQHATLVGLADSVDAGNLDAAQDAVVFVGTFARYAPMQLAPTQLGQMLGNTAAHELAHLLGLYHTQDPANLLDISGGAWDIAGQRGLYRAPLDPTVFPLGFVDVPQVLADTVGPQAVAIAE